VLKSLKDGRREQERALSSLGLRVQTLRVPLQPLPEAQASVARVLG
jgi:hypothetical protein